MTRQPADSGQQDRSGVFMTDHQMLEELYQVIILGGNGTGPLTQTVKEHSLKIAAVDGIIKARDRLFISIGVVLFTADIGLIVAILTHQIHLP